MAFASGNTFGVKPATTFGGFGSTSNATPAGAFGSQPTQSTSNTSSSFGPFGQGPSQINQSSQLPFGQPAQPQSQQQSNPQSSGLFGQPNQQQSSSPFAQSTQQQQPKPSLPLFGQPTTNPLFGGATQSTGASNIFGQGAQSTLGKTTNVQQQQSFMGAFPNPQTSIPTPSSFTKATKFNDLSDDLKKALEHLDAHIQGRMHIATDIKNQALGEDIEKTSALIRSVYHRTQDVSQMLEQDARMTDHLKAKLDQSVQDTIAATRIVEGFRNQHLGSMHLKNYALFPLEFFTGVANELKERLEWFKSTVEQIERKLVLTASRPQYTPQAITSTLQNQHRTFIRLANKTAELDAQLEEIKTSYREIYRAKTGSKRDPFEGGVSVLDIS